jgi:hypothetical protein
MNRIEIYIGRNKRLPDYIDETFENERIVQFLSVGKEVFTFTYHFSHDIISQKANCFSFYGSKSQQLRWYEVSLKVSFLEAFLSTMKSSDTYDTRDIEREIQTLRNQKWLILIEKVFSFLRIPSSLIDD